MLRGTQSKADPVSPTLCLPPPPFPFWGDVLYSASKFLLISQDAGQGLPSWEADLKHTGVAVGETTACLLYVHPRDITCLCWLGRSGAEETGGREVRGSQGTVRSLCFLWLPRPWLPWAGLPWL